MTDGPPSGPRVLLGRERDRRPFPAMPFEPMGVTARQIEAPARVPWTSPDGGDGPAGTPGPLPARPPRSRLPVEGERGLHVGVGRPPTDRFIARRRFSEFLGAYAKPFATLVIGSAQRSPGTATSSRPASGDRAERSIAATAGWRSRGGQPAAMAGDKLTACISRTPGPRRARTSLTEPRQLDIPRRIDLRGSPTWLPGPFLFAAARQRPSSVPQAPARADSSPNARILQRCSCGRT